jgi:hypothetical protein
MCREALFPFMRGERMRIWIDEDVNMRYIDYFRLCNFRGVEVW